MKINLKKEIIITGLLIFVCFGCVSETQYLENDRVDDVVLREPMKPPAPDLPALKLTQFRVVSLANLQAAARAGAGRKAAPNAIRNMCGLNSIDGFIIDRKNNDLLLFGKVADRMPPLLLEDFIVALRSAYKKYAVKGVFAPPEVSLDPSSEALGKIYAVEKKIKSDRSAVNWKKQKQAYERACKQRHTVKTTGMPPQSHFASVLVKADYDMKRIVNGSDNVYIPGVLNLYALKSYEARRIKLIKKATDNTTDTFSRFWLKPTQFHFKEQQGVVFLDKFEISLLTEQQYLSDSKNIKKTAKRDPLAEKVAQSITTYYTYIAQKRRVFRQLKELMRMYIVLEAMYNKDAHRESGLNLDYLLNTYRVPPISVPTSMPGLTRYVLERYEHTTFEETSRSAFVFPMCGGVTFDVFFRWDHFSRVVDPQLTTAFRSVIRQRPEANSLFWDVVQGQQRLNVKRLYDSGRKRKRVYNPETNNRSNTVYNPNAGNNADAVDRRKTVQDSDEVHNPNAGRRDKVYYNPNAREDDKVIYNPKEK